MSDIAHLVAHPHHILASSPGLGKTLECIRAMQFSFLTEQYARVLVICSKSSLGTWQQEISTWQVVDWPVTVLPIGRAARICTLNKFERGWLLINREALRLFVDELVKIGWWGIILDESHHFRSRPAREDRKSGRSQASAALLKLKARVQWAVSASLLDGDVRDMHTTLKWLWPKKFGSYWCWVLKHSIFEPDGYSMYGKYVGVKDPAVLRTELAPLILRRTKSEVAADLPPLRFQTVPITLSDKEFKLYTDMERDLLARFDNGVVLMASAKVAQLTRLSQLAVCAATFDKSIPSTKLEWVLDYLSGVPVGQSVVIASRFREPLIQLAAMLTTAGISHSLLIGGVDDRPQLMKDFQEGAVQVSLITIATGGESINLSRADVMIILDKTWSSIEIEQLQNRVHRNDKLTRSHSSVLVISLVATGTIDEAVEKVLERKGAVNDSIILSTAMEQMRQSQA